MYTGPHIITDGLVFGYDADDRSSRFYPGEPTINLASGLTVGAQGGSLTSTTSTPDGKYLTDNTGVGNSGLPMYHEVTNPNTGNNGGFQSQTHFNIVGGSTYLYISFKVYMTEVYSGTNRYLTGYAGFYNSSGVSTGNAGWTYTVDGVSDQSWSDNPAHLNKWIQVSGRATIPANTAKVHRWYVYADFLLTGKMYIAQLQVEESNNPTQFTSTSRSATQSLIDLKKTTTIDVSNVSFDSTAHPIFDGTDDSLYPNIISNGSGLTAITAEFVVKASANNKNLLNSSAGAAILHYGGAGFYLVSTDGTASGYLGWNGKLSGGGTGAYEHLVATYDGTTMRLYVNGESTGATRAYSAGATGVLKDLNGVRIGGNFNSTQPWFNGNIPIAKIYNQALTAEEVKQNFNAYKNRFNL